MMMRRRMMMRMMMMASLHGIDLDLILSLLLLLDQLVDWTWTCAPSLVMRFLAIQRNTLQRLLLIRPLNFRP